MGSPESDPTLDQDPKLQVILNTYGQTVIKNPHYGLPGHENDLETMLVSDTPTECPPFINTLLRAKDEDQVQAIINIYKVE